MTAVQDTTSSHDIALAIAIVMQEDVSGAGSAADEVQQRASRSGATLHTAAADIVTARTDRPSEHTAASSSDDRTGRDADVQTVQCALLTLMRENACNDNDAAMTIRARAAQHRLTILDVATSINELGDAS